MIRKLVYLVAAAVLSGGPVARVGAIGCTPAYCIQQPRKVCVPHDRPRRCFYVPHGAVPIL